MRLGVFSAIVLTALPLTAADASAQGRGRGQQGREEVRFQGMDRNGDGVITRAEWRGSAQSFRIHDWNRDGQLSGDEVRPGAQRNINRDEDDYNAQRAREFDDWTSEGFAYLDHNRDGRLSRDEWHYDVESWVRADRNRDNVLTREEFLGGDTVDTDRNDRFEYLDANNNGRVERREWHGDADTFAWLDRNNDGSLSRYEMRGQEDQGSSNQRESDLFASLDYNHDNRISQDEWHWSRRSFLQQDTNRDGNLSRDEFSDPEVPVGTSSGNNASIGRPVVVTVVGNRQWVDTGLDVRAGDVLTIRADGTVRLSGNGNDTATPGGGNRRAEGASLPNHPAGALIARVGNGAPIFVGDGRGINKLTTGGRLYLGVNDDHWDDNSGQFRATVTLRR
jgi:Ca2+-binding EF-hand superfamily protein